MELAVVIALGVIVAAVAIDTVRTRPPPRRPPDDDPALTSSQIIVDLSKRR